MVEKTNCPNCGAPINGIKCEYCGTQFFDLADLELNKPGFLRVRVGNRILLCEAIPTSVETEHSLDWTQPPKITIEFVVKRSRDGLYFVVKENENV